MTRYRELVTNWRYLAASSIGLGSGYLLTMYLTSLFAPHLLREFGWSKAQFSLIGSTVILSVICLPIAGRLTDRFGVRPMATAGVIATPLVFLGYSAMGGDFRQYFALAILQTILMGTTTSSMVYCRLIAESIHGARGAALAIAASTPAIIGALGVLALTPIIDRFGWRIGYVAVAGWAAIGGAIALMLIPRGSGKRLAVEPLATAPAARSYGAILHSRTFQIILAGMVLCNLPFMVQSSQLKLILLDRGVTSDAGSWMLSLYAITVVVGRVLCGLALDRWPPHIVVALALGLPAIGFTILASGIAAPGLLAAAVTLLGLAMGAEVDIMAFLVMRYFPVVIFSTVISLLGTAVALSGATGSLILSSTLAQGGSFTPFLILSAASVAIGAASFLLLGRERLRTDPRELKAMAA